MSKLKVYLSASFKADRVLVARVKDRLLEKDVEILTYTGNGWSLEDEKRLKSADVLVLVPHDKFASTFHLGAGQHNEIRRFYDTTKSGYKSMTIVYPNSNNVEVNADSALSFTSCNKLPSNFQNMVDNYSCVTGLNTHSLSTFIDINKALKEEKAPAYPSAPAKQKPSRQQTSVLPQEVIDAIAEAQRGSMMSINPYPGNCTLGFTTTSAFANSTLNSNAYAQASNARAGGLRFSSPKPDDSAWEMKMAATAISEPINIDDESEYPESLTPMLALYPIICKG